MLCSIPWFDKYRPCDLKYDLKNIVTEAMSSKEREFESCMQKAMYQYNVERGSRENVATQQQTCCRCTAYICTASCISISGFLTDMLCRP